MIVATALVLTSLIVVVSILHIEGRRRTMPTPARLQTVWQATDMGQLRNLRLPRASMGYDPIAVQAVLAAMSTAYHELAARSDPALVEQAWQVARGTRPDKPETGVRQPGSMEPQPGTVPEDNESEGDGRDGG